jgi:hypothetical protein
MTFNSLLRIRKLMLLTSFPGNRIQWILADSSVQQMFAPMYPRRSSHLA